MNFSFWGRILESPSESDDSSNIIGTRIGDAKLFHGFLV